MRRAAERRGRNYQEVGAFVDIDGQWSLHDDAIGDVAEAVDQRRVLELLPGRR